MKRLDIEFSKIAIHNGSSLRNRFFSSSNQSRRKTLVAQLSGIDLSFDNKTIFDNLSLDIYTGDRMMVFGENGAGKTTVARLLTSDLQPDDGEVIIHSTVKVGYLPQDLETFAYKHDIVSVGDYLLNPFPTIKSIWNEIASVKLQMSESQKASSLTDKLQALEHEFNREGGYKIWKMTRGLNITHLDFLRNFHSLSGGEKCRVALAGLLLQDPSLLILDEPTNHLDKEAKAWLIQYLRQYSGSLLVITHDRSFMSQVGNIMLMVDTKQKTVHQFHGGYKAFLQRTKLDFESDQDLKIKSQKNVDDIKGKLDRLTKKRVGVSRYVISDCNRITKLIKELKEAKSNQHQTTLSYVRPDFSFQTQVEKQSPKIRLSNVEKSFGNTTLFSRINANLDNYRKIVIVGENGCGKSTLLKIIYGEYLSKSNEYCSFDNVRLGYLPQESDDLDLDDTVISLFENDDIPLNTSMHYLRKICLFEYDMIHQKIGELSVGQRRKLQLARIIADKPNVLLLDEPTNHLDVLSAESLEEALNKFQGILLAVSHDEYFIKNVATDIWSLSEGKLAQHDQSAYKRLT